MKSGFIGTFTVLTAVLEIILAQNKFEVLPDDRRKCNELPFRGKKAEDCCKYPSLFTTQQISVCERHIKALQIVGRKFDPSKCDYELCLLDNNGLLKNDDNINIKKMINFLDQYAFRNRKFIEPIEIAKKRCFRGVNYGPHDACKTRKLLICIEQTLFTECPLWQVTRICKLFKEFFENCRRFLPQ